MVCKNCGGTNVVEGVVFGYSEAFRNIGPKYGSNIMLTFIEETFCDLCEDCGEIQRLYIRPNTKKQWITKDIVRNLSKIESLKRSEEERQQIQEEINYYSELLINKQCHKHYVDDLFNYIEHEWYEYPVKTKGPTYRLYREKGTNQAVLIRPTTMNLHLGKYVVCDVPNQDDDPFAF